MRLLRVRDHSFELFWKERPSYAILSHRWTGDETLFQDVERGALSQKLLGFLSYTRTNLRLEYIWMDSCCINQDSSAELSEGVNSMFEWYRNARLCVAYLADVQHPSDKVAFRNSVWFKRGWTLQELVASTVVLFVTESWEVIGHKGSIGHLDAEMQTGPNIELLLAEITNIPPAVIQDFSNSLVLSVEQRMEWMAGRETSREEDLSYALFGIFGVTPGAIYGEKKAGAAQRLREAITRKNAMTPSPPGKTHSAAVKSMPRLVLRHIQQYYIDGSDSGWEVIDDMADGHQASFMALYPDDTRTTLRLTLPSPHGESRADWVIDAPNAEYYPGRHEGHLIFLPDFPFKPPAVWWDSPLLSPYPRNGHFSGGLGEMWTPGSRRLLDIIETMASLILRSPKDAAEPSRPGHFYLHPLPKPDFLGEQLLDIDELSMRQCTQFFCRAYNRIEGSHGSSVTPLGDDDPAATEQITDHHRETSIQAIRSFIDNILSKCKQVEPPYTIDGLEAETYFAKVVTVRDWLSAERQWARMLDEKSHWLVSQDRYPDRNRYYHM